MNHNRISRRHFTLNAGIIAGGAAAFAPQLCQQAVAQAGGTLRIRRDVTDPAAEPDLKAYAKAVEVMKNRDLADPTGWQAQGKIHLDYCPHGNWFFLPWHRAYLAHFEKICAEASGKPDFALPYWNWTTQRTVPASFWAGAGSDLASLNDRTRRANSSTKMPRENVNRKEIDEILKIPDFEMFASTKSLTQRGRTGKGELESSPHDNVHGAIGGNMSTFWSPLDPIFWLHHGNVDRLWTAWIEADGNHANSSDPDWLDFAFKKNFVQPDGSGVASVKVKQTLSTNTFAGYRYDTQKETVAPLGPGFRMTGKPGSMGIMSLNSKMASPRTALLVQLPPPSNAMSKELRSFASDPEEKTANSAVRLVIDKVMPPDDLSTRVRVFFDAPEVTPKTSPNDPHYVGTFTFFGNDHVGGHGDADHGSEMASYVFNLGPVLRRLQEAGQEPLEDGYTVQLITVPPPGLKSQVLAGRFQIEYVERPNPDA